MLVVALAGAALVLTAAGVLRAQPADTGAAQSPPAAAAVDVPAMLEDAGFRYLPAGKRDPFKDLLGPKPGGQPVEELPPIQQFDLSQVQITGVILDEINGHRVMIKGPGGSSFVVKKGDVIGKHQGEITEVTLQGIRVVEKYEDYGGEEILKEVFVKARKDK